MHWKTAALAIAVLLLAACGGGGATPQVAPSETETATPVPAEAETPTPEPTPLREMTDATCPHNRERAGRSFSFDSRVMNRSDALSANCGAVIPPSAWNTRAEEDALTGKTSLTAYSESRDHDIDTYSGDPWLSIGCFEGVDLVVAVWFGASLASDWRRGHEIQTAYRFNDGRLVEQYWDGEPGPSDFALAPERYNRNFVASLRDEGELVFRAFGAFGDTYTITFDLTGVDRDVEPVLDECGY